jgi:hypothetical protein
MDLAAEGPDPAATGLRVATSSDRRHADGVTMVHSVPHQHGVTPGSKTK